MSDNPPEDSPSEEPLVHAPHDEFLLSWQKMDLENRLGFTGAKYTDVNHVLALFVAILLVAAFYAFVVFGVRDTLFGNMFLDRPSRLIPFSIVFFSAWAIAVLFIKWRKLAFQQRTLRLDLVPQDRDFVLSPSTAGVVLGKIYSLVDHPRHFVLLSRMERALSNLSNIGRVGDVIEMLHAQAQHDEDHTESSYTIVRSFIWGVPVLGFIGTVLGLSIAIGGFGSVLSATGDLSRISEHLKGVTGGLQTAFETTLQGLVAALTIQLALTALKKKEERFLDDCKEYCHANIVAKLRLLALDDFIHTPGRNAP